MPMTTTTFAQPATIRITRARTYTVMPVAQARAGVALEQPPEAAGLDPNALRRRPRPQEYMTITAPTEENQEAPEGLEGLSAWTAAVAVEISAEAMGLSLAPVSDGEASPDDADDDADDEPESTDNTADQEDSSLRDGPVHPTLGERVL